MKIKCIVIKSISEERVLLDLELLKPRKEVLNKIKEYVQIWAVNRLNECGWCEPEEIYQVLRSNLISEGYVKLLE